MVSAIFQLFSHHFVLAELATSSIRLNPSNAEANFVQKHKDAKLSKNHPNPVMLVFFGLLSHSTLRLVPMCQGFSHFSRFLHHVVMAKLATSSIRFKTATRFTWMNLFSVLFTAWLLSVLNTSFNWRLVLRTTHRWHQVSWCTSVNYDKRMYWLKKIWLCPCWH